MTPPARARVSSWSARDFPEATRRRSATTRSSAALTLGTVGDVADHIDHVVDLVGLGSDYDGVFTLPANLQDVRAYRT